MKSEIKKSDFDSARHYGEFGEITVRCGVTGCASTVQGWHWLGMFYSQENFSFYRYIAL